MNETAAGAQFANQSYLNLETFRKNGQGVKTPVWFVQDEGKLYVRTMAQSAKMKRLRRTPAVRVAPCQANGALKGEWVEAYARQLDDPALVEHVNKLLNRKYGLLKRLFDLRQKSKGYEMGAIEITLPG